MFKEKYIKANNSIRPDEKFLESLKENVKQEEKYIQISEYVEYDEVANVKAYRQGDVSEKNGRFSGWKKMVGIAACFAIVCVVVFMAGGQAWLDEGNGLGADIETIFRRGQEATSEISESTAETLTKDYKQLVDWLKVKQVEIYEVEGFLDDQSGLTYINQALEQGRKLSIQERDTLVGDILAERYSVVNHLDELKQPTCYVVKFSDDSGVCFAIGVESDIYIQEVFGLQDMAKW